MFNRFFRSKPRLHCPRCLELTPLNETPGQDTICEHCQYAMPLLYSDTYKDAPPLFIQVFGWTAHGKTMYMDVLRLMLFEMGKLWHNYVYMPATKVDIELARDLRKDRIMSVDTISTQKRERDENDVYIMILKNMSRYKSRAMVIMDHPGEFFEDFDNVPVKEIPFLIKTPTTFMIVSLPDMLGNGTGESIDELMSIFGQTMRRHDPLFKGRRRKLVVVLTKGDMINNLPPNLAQYLREDDIWSKLYSNQQMGGLISEYDMAMYVERMGRVSQEIEDWLRYSVQGGASFLGQIRDYNLDVRYCVISATGQQVKGSGTQITPRRVLDPFLWALEFQSQPVAEK